MHVIVTWTLSRKSYSAHYHTEYYSSLIWTLCQSDHAALSMQKAVVFKGKWNTHYTEMVQLFTFEIKGTDIAII